MSLTLTASLIQRFPNLKLVEEGGRILSVCSVDQNRCLHPKEPEEDYSLLPGEGDQTLVVRIFTTFKPSCGVCERRK